jgi:hypothetical protein
MDLLLFLLLRYPMTENRLRSDSRLGWSLFLKYLQAARFDVGGVPWKLITDYSCNSSQVCVRNTSSHATATLD